MITANDDQRSPSHARSVRNDRLGVARYCQANAATTVMIPYGSSSAALSARRPASPRRRISAMPSPAASSRPTASTVMTAVAARSAQNTGADSTAA